MATDHDLNLTLRVFDEGSSKLAAFAAKLGAMQKAGAKFALPIVQGVAGVGSALGRVGSEALGLGLRFAGLAAGAGFALWRIVDGKLYLNITKNVVGFWEEDIPGNISKADGSWGGIGPSLWGAAGRDEEYKACT